MLVPVVLGGCTFGAGSAYVGQWRPHTERVVDACLEDQIGHCIERKSIDKNVPARTFWGAMLETPLGVAVVDGEATFRAEAAASFVRGHGKFAWAIRGGIMLDLNRYTAATVLALGYYSLLPRVAVRAGIGYAPWAVAAKPGEQHETTHVGGRALVGAEYVFYRSRGENYLALTLDVDRTYLAFNVARATTGIISSIGWFF